MLAETMYAPNQRDVLGEIVREIVRVSHPERVILFGSRAKGTANRESDYDFLIVVPSVDNEREISRQIYRALLNQKVGVAGDAIVVDAQTLARRRASPYFITDARLTKVVCCMSETEAKIWLQRATSNLQLAQRGEGHDVLYEDLCFEAQQAAEKSLKALLITLTGDFPKVHSIGLLLQRVEEHMPVPDTIKEAVDLTDYAVQFR